MKPNLFGFATSELSQDAFICWFVSWADTDARSLDSGLHEAAREFLAELFELHNCTLPPIESIEVKRQEGDLDVIILINNEWGIMIEDKTFTKQHSNQLIRYKEYIHRKYPHIRQIPIYLTINLQSNLQPVLEAGYHVYNRQKFIRLLSRYHSITNDIFQDYLSYLQQINNQFYLHNQFPFNEWKGRRKTWLTVFDELRSKGLTGNYGYVSNPRGGFYGFWIKTMIDHPLSPYIQLEQDRICVKVKKPDSSFDIKELRATSKQVTKEVEGLNRPSRLKAGKTMTVAIGGYVCTDDQGMFELDKTAQKIKDVQERVRDCFTKSS